MSASTKLQVRPIQPFDLKILERLGSPLVRRETALRKNPLAPETAYTLEECCEMAFQFTRPLSAVTATLQRGRKFFRNQAVQATRHISIPDGKLLIGEIVENFAVFAKSL